MQEQNKKINATTQLIWARDNWNTLEETFQMTAKEKGMGPKARPLIGSYLLSHAQCQYAPPQ